MIWTIQTQFRIHENWDWVIHVPVTQVQHHIFVNTSFWGDPFTQGSLLSAFNLCLTQFYVLGWEEVLRKNTEGHGQFRECLCLSTHQVNEEMPTDTKTLFKVLQSTHQLDVLGLEQESVFSSWDMYGFLGVFFEFLSTMPLRGSMSEPSSWGFFWHWSRHLGLSLSYFIPFVMWISLYTFHIALTSTIPVSFYLLCKLKAHCFTQVCLKSIALILNESSYHHNLSRITMAKISVYLITSLIILIRQY